MVQLLLLLLMVMVNKKQRLCVVVRVSVDSWSVLERRLSTVSDVAPPADCVAPPRMSARSDCHRTRIP